MEWKYNKFIPQIKENIIIVDFKNLNLKYPYKYPIKIKNGLNNCNFNCKWLKSEIVKNEFSNIDVYFSNNGQSNKKNYEEQKTIKIKEYIEFLNSESKDYKYVFHKFIMNMENLILKEINIKDYIPNFNLNNISCKLSEFYLGDIKTGTHLHNHINVLNFLIYGKKLWIIFPPTSTNKTLIKENNWIYTNLNENVYDFFIKNINYILKNFKNVTITFQESNEIIYIPNKFYHLVINYSENIGFTLRFPILKK
jgi:hypothetical protein